MAGRRNANANFGSGGGSRGKFVKKDQEETPSERKANEYMRSLLAEKLALDKEEFPIVAKLLDQEITRAQAEGKGPKRDQKFMNVYRDRPALVVARVLIPVKEHPTFNFIGKLLGPGGSILKALQEDTMCRMTILGRGSMRDSNQEEELRKSLDPKYAHLSDDLHVEISALGPPAEAYARIAFALTEIQKLLVPDEVDDFNQGPPPLEMQVFDNVPAPSRSAPSGVMRGQGIREDSAMEKSRFLVSLIQAAAGITPTPPQRQRGQTSKPLPLLGAAPRMSGPRGMRGSRPMMDDSFDVDFEESYEEETSFDDFPSAGPSRSGYAGNRFGSSDYDVDYYDNEPSNYTENQPGRSFKGRGTGRFEPPSRRPEQPRYRAAPYGRPGK